MADAELSRRLADIARDVQSGDDLGQAAQSIVEATQQMLPRTAAAGITLARKHHRLATIAATSDLATRGDELQYDLGEGPCIDAAWEQHQVYAGDLAPDERWPRWAPKVAEELGVHSMLCLQLFTHHDRLGALNIYATERYAFDAEDREVAQLLAAHAAVAVAAAQQIQTLKHAVDTRTTIGKAIGIVMTTYQLDDEQAFAVLQRLSSHQNRKLHDIARDIVDDGTPRPSLREQHGDEPPGTMEHR